MVMSHGMSYDGEPYISDVERKSGTALAVSTLPSAFSWRLRLLTAGLRTYRPNQPSVRLLKVNGFDDAYRFWLRLCGCQAFSCKCCAGYVRCTAVIDGTGLGMELVERTWHHGTVAILRIGKGPSDLLVRKIIFRVTDTDKRSRYDGEHREWGARMKEWPGMRRPSCGYGHVFYESM